MARKLFIEVEESNPFGDDIDQAVLTRPDRSSTFVPGYSDKRHQNEVKMERGEKPDTLDHRFHWARRMNLSGEDFGGGVQRQIDQGYEVANYDDLIKQGYNLKQNAAIKKAPDGSAILGDMVLTVIDARGAAAHWQKNRDAVEAQESRPEAMMDEAIGKFNRSDVAQRGKMKASAFEMVEE